LTAAAVVNLARSSRLARSRTVRASSRRCQWLKPHRAASLREICGAAVYLVKQLAPSLTG
jgi:hypothetical protein